ncbi:Uncharacterised protein [Serratia liquefaciens]|jgi:hypothetical protein|nr:hypothetical protein 220p1_00063 [Serratia entomophila]CAI1942732.1 Uncharacterised protein [Serratia quinivorans]CAI2001208.1 Uncharacterised protein [Serratia liquefaciens]CAI2009232.1 Uncharacterised protein [Serratia liquefaciens]CAI2159809.1 Uncharacterised protein [Serratia quinivorans]
MSGLVVPAFTPRCLRRRQRRDFSFIKPHREVQVLWEA